ncbi:hypothetical protein ABHN84_20225 [Shewanella vesiculosa]|uniref:Uncharacterized protein n=1 Tax=Shewanella vesiculosa TaxID=518738 RepID=A0ABV0FX64_9GAMM
MTNLINRNGSFNYSAFVKQLSATLEPGQVIHPRCVREIRGYGNTDPIEKAEKALRSAFEMQLGSINPNFKRKRAPHGGYEYLRV